MCVECVRRLSLWLNGEASPVQLVASWSWRCGVEHQVPRTPDHEIFRSNWITFPKIFSVKELDDELVRFLPYQTLASAQARSRWRRRRVAVVGGRWQEHAGDVAGGRARRSSSASCLRIGMADWSCTNLSWGRCEPTRANTPKREDQNEMSSARMNLRSGTNIFSAAEWVATTVATTIQVSIRRT
jgi:hypothetical protein